MDISIIMVNYNTCDLTRSALESLFQSNTTHRFEVILIDNNSSDLSVETIKQNFPNIILIENTANLGFAKANNQGIRIAKGRYILLLNSDTTVEPDTLETMVKFMDNHPNVGAAGCKVLLPDGSLDKACRRGFPTPLTTFYYVSGLSRLFPKSRHFNSYHMEYLDEDEEYPVDCLVGAFLMVRREVIEQVGLLDERFFMYFEDTDWCYRIQQAGWINYYYPKTQITHYKRGSSRGRPFRITYEFHRAMKLFYDKHYRHHYSFLVTLFMYTGIALKFAVTVCSDLLWKMANRKSSSATPAVQEQTKGVSAGQ